MHGHAGEAHDRAWYKKQPKLAPEGTHSRAWDAHGLKERDTLITDKNVGYYLQFHL
jgi:hypothetical protein